MGRVPVAWGSRPGASVAPVVAGPASIEPSSASPAVVADRAPRERAGRPEPAVDADREAASLQQRQGRQDGRDGPAGHGHQLVDGRPAGDAAPGRSGRPRRPARAAWPPASSVAPGAARRSREPQVLDELRDARHDPGPPGNSRRNARQPADAGASIAPGTRKQSRPCSSAQDAVMSAPLRAGASTTTVASASPLMIRFRRGNVPCGRRHVRRELGDDRTAAGDDRLGQAAVRPRVQAAVAAADDRDGRAAGVEGRRVGGAVDADRQPGHDRSRRPPSSAPAIRDARARPAFGRSARARRPRSRAARRGRPGRRARTGGAAACRSRRAATGRPGPRRSRREAERPDPVQRPVGIAAAARTISAATSGDSVRRPGIAVGRRPRPTPRRAARRRRSSRRRAGCRAPIPSRRRRSANPTGPRPCAAARTAQASRSAARSPPSTRPPSRTPRAARRERPVRADAEHLSAPGSAAATCRRRAEPGGLVEMRLGRPRRRRPGRRSSARPGAAAPCRGRWPRSSSARRTTCARRTALRRAGRTQGAAA